MKLYEQKELHCHFVVLCPDFNLGHLRSTVSSITGSYPQSGITAVLSEEVHPDDLADAQKVCKTVKAGKSITGMINAGLKEGGQEWNLVVVAGSWLRGWVIRKMSNFVESEYDILFPVVDRRYLFKEATINGILIHRKAFDAVGPMADNNPIEVCKMMWELDAKEKGCKFKAVVGCQIM